MCQWTESGASDLYAHSVLNKKIFAYSRTGKPASLGSCFESGLSLAICKSDTEEYEPIKHKLVQNQLIFIGEDTLGAEKCYSSPLTALGNGSYRLESSLTFHIKNYNLRIFSRTLLSAQNTGSNEYISFSRDDSKNAYEFWIDNMGSFRGDRLDMLMEGEAAGCFLIKAITQMSDLHMGLCFSMGGDGFLRQPFDHSAGSAEIEALIDPMNPLDKIRSNITLPEGEYTSCFTVYCADNLKFTADKGKMRLYFSNKRKYEFDKVTDYYLSPEGEFVIASGDGDLITGFCGLEYIRFKRGDFLLFKHGQKAHFTLFNDLEEDEPGDTSYTTVPGGMYYSQSEDSAFYGSDQKRQKALCHVEVPFSLIDRNTFIPVAPIGETGNKESFDKAPVMEKIDSRRLAQRRNQIISAAAKLPYGLDLSEKDVITDKGLVVKYAEGSDYFSKIEIGQGFSLINAKGKIKQSLLSARSFLVISDVKEFLNHIGGIEDSELYIDGWSFRFIEKYWDDSTLLLMKFTTHKSIRDLLDTPKEWSYPNTDEKLIEGAKSKLGNIIYTLLERDGSRFEYIKEIIDDKYWCGAVMFNLKLDVNSFPRQLRFLVRSQPDIQLYADHLVFSKRTMSETGEISPSVVSGLIFYEDNTHKIMSWQTEFFYKLDELTVVIRNSTVTFFSCRLSLLINYLLGSPLRAIDSDIGNYILINGRMQKGDDTEGAVYYYFELDQERSLEFLGSAISKIKISGVSIWASETENRVKFSLSGAFEFLAYESDILSYSELKFLDFAVTMDEYIYAAHFKDMKYLKASSTVREGSLAEWLPVSLTEIITPVDKASRTPEQLGYEGISTDGITQVKLEGTWTGICWEIGLGGLGKLASSVNLSFKIIIAWNTPEIEKTYESVRTGTPGLYVGAKLGNFNGVTGNLPLQGVMSLGFEAVEIKKSQTSGEFYLYFKDFALKLLKFQFPDGNNNIYVFGNKENPEELGFYGAYEG